MNPVGETLGVVVNRQEIRMTRLVVVATGKGDYAAGSSIRARSQQCQGGAGHIRQSR